MAPTRKAAKAASAENEGEEPVVVQKAAKKPKEQQSVQQQKPQGLLWMCVPLVVALFAAYFGGFLTVSRKAKLVLPAHHRASQPSAKQAAAKHKPGNPTAQLAALNLSSPWLSDEAFLAQSQVQCGFRVVQASDINADMFREADSEMSRTPLLIRGLTSKWPAHERWQRPKLIELFGNKTILSGSESSIVYGGGTATMPMRLVSFLAAMRRPSKTMPDAFTFDVGVLESIPDLLQDYRPPLLFNSWDNPQERREHNAWHMLSLGASRQGLPFHSHGKTWLALMHGKKRWLVYPPGYSAPAELQRQYNPLKSVYAWVAETLPLLAHLPVPTIEPADAADETMEKVVRHDEGYQPVQCLQEEGDIVYLPDGWAHMTINVGEAIGIGGQAGMTTDARLAVGKRAVAVDEHNFDGHKFAALALAHMAIEEEHRVKSQLTATAAGMVQLREDNFEDTVLDSEDTWLVQYFSADTPTPPDTQVWNHVASKLRGLVSVGAMNLSAAGMIEHGFAEGLEAGPRVRLYLGNGLRGSVAECAQDGIDFSAPEAGAAEAEASAAPAAADQYVDFAISGTALRGGQLAGSVIAVTARGKRLFREAEYHQRACLALQPLHPEGHGLLAELLGHAQQADSMAQVLAQAEALYDGLDAKDYSPHSLASVYHKLATVYLGKEQGAKALPLLQRSLQVEPTYLPALIDTAIAHFYNADEGKAEMALRAVDRLSPNHVSAAKLREAMKKNKAIRGGAARRGTMGTPNKPGPGPGGGPGFRGGKPNPQMAARQAKMAAARAQAEQHAAKGRGAKSAKGFAPTAARSAADMMETMQAQLEAELERRRSMGEDVKEPRRRQRAALGGESADE